MLAFSLTIFTSAWLLFLVQPLIARFILPWFGGSPAVWTTCMLFFQTLLPGGYAYAHLITRKLAPRHQVLLHMALLAAILLLLPITPADHWKPPDGAHPTWRILVLLTVCLGAPYLALSATGPLVQAWFSQARPGVAPYRLYALSNAGSLLALASYPFLVEPNFSRQAQARWWSLGFGVFALMVGWCGALVWKGAGNRAAAAPAPASETERTGVAGLWFLLPACASVLLLAVTNKICEDIAVVPFLWVLPLGAYLLSFIVSFDNPRWYGRRFWLPALVLALGALLCVMLGGKVEVGDTAPLALVRWLFKVAEELSIFKVIGIYLASLFVACMVCHGELYRLRPAPRRLTAYYLTIAAGGAFGGMFVAVLAPRLFSDYFELHVGLLAVALLTLVVLFVDPKSLLHQGKPVWAWVILLLGVMTLADNLREDVITGARNVVERSRTFYGVLKVEEFAKDDPVAHELRLVHGGTTHGLQYVAAGRRELPTSYYTHSSGIGRTFENMPRGAGRRVGVAGLGTGTLLAWGREGDYFRVYEINEDVRRLASRRFTYLRDTRARVDVVMGDARLSMEREPDQQFDILALDTFSSDAIPVHMLTREAFETYRRHLKPEGVIAVHISNGCLDLEPVVRLAAAHLGFGVALIEDVDTDENKEDENRIPVYASDWVLLTRNLAFLKLPGILTATSPATAPARGITMWTDEESNLFRVLELDDDGWLGLLRRWQP